MTDYIVRNSPPSTEDFCLQKWGFLDCKKQVTAILSEGEQKAVGLALFLAEASMQKQPNPIILDDPVNSLDHKIASFFADRLLELDNQVIVFTHNKLFLDAFETSKKGHICKTINNVCNKNRGKHIYLYSVQSEGKSAKGIIISRRKNTAKTHIDISKQLLAESPFNKTVEVGARIRRTVECIVDEKVFNQLIPTRLSSKNHRICWDDLKNLNNDPTLIDSLRNIHDRASGGNLHNGTEAEENPIEKDEFMEMVERLENHLL